MLISHVTGVVDIFLRTAIAGSYGVQILIF